MTISTFSELVTATQAWLMDRTDINAYVPDLITLGEGVINFGFDAENSALNVDPLRCRDMELISTLTSTNGVAPLPDTYLQYRRLVPSSGMRNPIKFTTPDGADALYPTGQAGIPCHFSIVGANLYTYPKTSDNLELTHYQMVPPLTAAAPTNWLLTKNPGVYLRTTLMMAAEFIKDQAEMERQAFMSRGLIGAMNKSDDLANYARAGVTLRGNTP